MAFPDPGKNGSKRCSPQRAVLRGEGARENRRKLTTFSPFFPLAETTFENSQSYEALAFMTTEHGAGSRRGGFRRKKAIGKSVAAALLRSGEQAIIVAASIAADFELPASCRLGADVEGRRNSMRCFSITKCNGRGRNAR